MFIHQDQTDPVALDSLGLDPRGAADRPYIQQFEDQVRGFIGEAGAVFSPRDLNHNVLRAEKFYARKTADVTVAQAKREPVFQPSEAEAADRAAAEISPKGYSAPEGGQV